jgi:hypothetical protein
MNWLKQKLRRWLQEEDCYSTVAAPISSNKLGVNSVEVEGLAFSVMSARGGTIVQIRHYDRKTDRVNYVTHVIPDGEDIANSLGHIVSMELLRV